MGSPPPTFAQSLRRNHRERLPRFVAVPSRFEPIVDVDHTAVTVSCRIDGVELSAEFPLNETTEFFSTPEASSQLVTELAGKIIDLADTLDVDPRTYFQPAGLDYSFMAEETRPGFVQVLITRDGMIESVTSVDASLDDDQVHPDVAELHCIAALIEIEASWERPAEATS